MKDPFPKLNKLYESNSFRWRPATRIPPRIEDILSMIPTVLRTTMMVAEQVVDGFWTFKIDDPVVRYLFVNENRIHVWGNTKFDNIKPNDAMAHLMHLERPDLDELDLKKTLVQMDIALGRNPDGQNLKDL